MTIDIRKYINGPRLEFEVHWPQYFKDFCAIHGNPVEVRGRLLFPDGWGYGMQYEGPEYAPPEDPEQLRLLQVDYWQANYALRKRLAEQAEWIAKNAAEVQAQRSAPISRIVNREENGRLATTVELVDLVELKSLAELLAEDVEECRQELEKLNAAPV